MQVLLLDIDKKWWIDFKENQKMIWPNESEIEELNLNNNLRNVAEGEAEIEDPPENTLRTRQQSKRIEVSNQLLRYSDLEVDNIVIVKDDNDEKRVGSIKELNEEDDIIEILLYTKQPNQSWKSIKKRLCKT